METLNQDMKEHSFRKVYLLYGEEAFLKKSYKNRLKEAITGGDSVNYQYFEGKGITASQIRELADTMPFFGEKRLIQIEDSGFFKGTAEGQDLADYLKEMPESTCLLFVESEVDKRSRLFKEVKKLGYGAELVHQDSAQLGRWAAGILKREGKQITGRTMELLLSKTGDDMENIKSELEKLLAYTLGRDVISEADVEAVCTTQVTSQIFEMLTAISGRKTRKALDLYEDLLTLREPPMRILALIARQFNQILQVKELMSAGMNQKTIAQKLKLSPYVAGKIMQQARQFTGEQALAYVTLCADTDEAVKTGRLQDRLAVELLITNRY